MGQVRIEVTLPAAPQQAGQHVKRVVSVTVAGTPQPSFDVEPAINSGAALVVDATAAVQVSVIEVLANGKQSSPCVSPAIVPADLAEAIAADPAGFAFKVTPIASS